MIGVFGVVIGLFLIGVVLSERGGVRAAWSDPARWWKPGEVTRSREADQPLPMLLGLVLGICALVYGIACLL